MRYLIPARNSILPRVSLVVRFVVNPNKMTGFSTFERLADTTCVTRLNYSSLQKRNSLNSVRLVSLPNIRATLTRTTNLVTWLFHPLGNLIYIYKRTPRGVPKPQRPQSIFLFVLSGSYDEIADLSEKALEFDI